MPVSACLFPPLPLIPLASLHVTYIILPLWHGCLWHGLSVKQRERERGSILVEKTGSMDGTWSSERGCGKTATHFARVWEHTRRGLHQAGVGRATRQGALGGPPSWQPGAAGEVLRLSRSNRAGSFRGQQLAGGAHGRRRYPSACAPPWRMAAAMPSTTSASRGISPVLSLLHTGCPS